MGLYDTLFFVSELLLKHTALLHTLHILIAYFRAVLEFDYGFLAAVDDMDISCFILMWDLPVRVPRPVVGPGPWDQLSARHRLIEQKNALYIWRVFPFSYFAAVFFTFHESFRRPVDFFFVGCVCLGVFYVVLFLLRAICS